MKKILISLMVIAVAVGLVASASGAWFTDTEKSVGNSFQSGTIDIAVNGDNPWSEPFALTDMKPCDWVSQEFVIRMAFHPGMGENIKRKLIASGVFANSIQNARNLVALMRLVEA